MALRPIIALLALLLLAGCKKEQWDDCITSTGPLRSGTRVLEGFHTVDLSDRIDLVLDHVPITTIDVEAGSNLTDQVITEVRDSILYIRNENRCNWVRSFKPRITVKVPIDAVRTLTLRGTGNISATDTVTQEVFRIEQWLAMGTADLIVDVNSIYVGLHTGAGDVKLYGRVEENANFYSGIMGTIDAAQLQSRTVNINNSGVGDFHCWAIDALNVQINDAGNVYYRGDPEVECSINGSGELIRIE